MTGSSTTADIAPLTSHLSKVCTLHRRNNPTPERQALSERWKVLLELLDVAGDFMLEREKSVTPATAGSKVAWETVAGILLSHKAHGIRWSELASKLMASDVGPSSKGGASQLVTAMRAAGWLEATVHGREKVIHPGPKIHLSTVWQKAFPSAEGQESAPRSSSGEALTSNAAYARTIEILQDTLCKNQSSILETFYLASEKHRLLKESPKEPELRKELRSNLLTFLNNALVTTAADNFNHLKKYFRLRGSQPARMCIKGNWTDANKHQLIVDVLRDRATDGLPDSSRIEDNTGFVKVKESGRCVLINDIPKAAWTEGYKNPRLHMSRFQELVATKGVSSSGTPLISKEEWNSCWTSGSNTDSSSCYRSTLIIPITLVNNELSKEFVKSLDARIEGRGLPGIRRIILGYLCLDHEEAGYFDPVTDVRLGYIFADILSIYLFMRYNYTQLSNTIQELGRCEITANEMLAEAQRKMRLQPRVMERITDESESKDNLLLDVDQGIFGALVH